MSRIIMNMNHNNNRLKRHIISSSTRRVFRASSKLFHLAWILLLLYALLQLQTAYWYHHHSNYNYNAISPSTDIFRWFNEDLFSAGAARTTTTKNKKVMPWSQRLHNGRTVRDMLQRVLSRRIASSNVLVITPTKVTDLISKFENGPGQAVYDKAVQEKHSVHYLDSGRDELDLDHWWRSEHNYEQQNWFLFTFITVTPPNNILGNGVYDGGNGNEMKAAVLPNGDKTRNASVDKIFSSADVFLSEATLTYLVFEVTVTAPSSSFDGLSLLTVGGSAGDSYSVDGREALSALFERKYKVQLLASTHILKDWVPNSLLTNKNVDLFFATAADMLQSQSDGSFHAYIFATQGLDLAIPSQSNILDYESSFETTADGNGLGGFYANTEKGIIPQCPISDLNVEFLSKNVSRNSKASEHRSFVICLFYNVISLLFR